MGTSWAIGAWAVGTWAAGTWVDVAVSFEDLTTVFVEYVGDLRTATPTAVDSDSLIAANLATVRAAKTYLDLNTAYAAYLSD